MPGDPEGGASEDGVSAFGPSGVAPSVSGGRRDGAPGRGARPACARVLVPRVSSSRDEDERKSRLVTLASLLFRKDAGVFGNLGGSFFMTVHSTSAASVANQAVNR